jgi:hypothetical protein
VTRWKPLRPDVTLVCLGGPEPLTQSVQQRVDLAWKQACVEDSTLFDGGVFSHHRLEEDADGWVKLIEGRVVPYSWYVACRVDRALGEELGLWVMGVSGLLLCPDGAVVGRRSTTVSGAGQIELAPAGTIGRSDVTDGMIDVRRCILSELDEELGLKPEDLSSQPLPFALIEDDTIRVADVALQMSTPLGFAQIALIHEKHSGREYDQLSLAGASTFESGILLSASRALIGAADALLDEDRLSVLGSVWGRGIVH